MIYILIWEQKEHLQSPLQRRETSPRINILPAQYKRLTWVIKKRIEINIFIFDL
jgi:hypothetical protein